MADPFSADKTDDEGPCFGKDAFKLEILCIMGWVGIWEATEIFLTERPELIMMKKNLANMQNAEIVITYPESE